MGAASNASARVDTCTVQAKGVNKAVSLVITPEGDVRGTLGGEVDAEAAKTGVAGVLAAALEPKRLQQPRLSSKWALQVHS